LTEATGRVGSARGHPASAAKPEGYLRQQARANLELSRLGSRPEAGDGPRTMGFGSGGSPGQPTMNEETLFHEALAKLPGARAAFLDGAGAGQPDLRAAVGALLAGHEAWGRTLNQPSQAFEETVGSTPIPAEVDATAARTPEPAPAALRGATTVDYQGKPTA